MPREPTPSRIINQLVDLFAAGESTRNIAKVTGQKQSTVVALARQQADLRREISEARQAILKERDDRLCGQVRTIRADAVRCRRSVKA